MRLGCNAIHFSWTVLNHDPYNNKSNKLSLQKVQIINCEFYCTLKQGEGHYQKVTRVSAVASLIIILTVYTIFNHEFNKQIHR